MARSLSCGNFRLVDPSHPKTTSADRDLDWQQYGRDVSRSPALTLGSINDSANIALGYPYFPAEVVDAVEDYREVPDMVWAVRPNDEEERLWLVRFFDRSRSYGWCPAVNLHDLGDDDGQYSSAVNS
jgi:hypothetical protein